MARDRPTIRLVEGVVGILPEVLPGVAVLLPAPAEAVGEVRTLRRLAGSRTLRPLLEAEVAKVLLRGVAVEAVAEARTRVATVPPSGRAIGAETIATMVAIRRAVAEGLGAVAAEGATVARLAPTANAPIVPPESPRVLGLMPVEAIPPTEAPTLTAPGAGSSGSEEATGSTVPPLTPRPPTEKATPLTPTIALALALKLTPHSVSE